MKNQTPTLKQLKAKYRYIVAYCKYMDSVDWFLEAQLWCAYHRDVQGKVCRINDMGVNATDRTNKMFEDLGEQGQAGVRAYL